MKYLNLLAYATIALSACHQTITPEKQKLSPPSALSQNDNYTPQSLEQKLAPKTQQHELPLLESHDAEVRAKQKDDREARIAHLKEQEKLFELSYKTKVWKIEQPPSYILGLKKNMRNIQTIDGVGNFYDDGKGLVYFQMDLSKTPNTPFPKVKISPPSLPKNNLPIPDNTDFFIDTSQSHKPKRPHFLDNEYYAGQNFFITLTKP